MKINRWASMATLFVLFGTVAPASALQGRSWQNGESGKLEHQDKKNESRGQGNRDHGRPERGERPAQAPARPSRMERGRVEYERPAESRPAQRSQPMYRPEPRVRNYESRNVWSPYRAQNWNSEHRDWGARGGYHGFRVPETRFRAYFGPRHYFHVRSLPVIVVGGYPRVQYGGYWFALVDPWPEYWADNWYDSDDVYIDYFGDGYYLCDRRYPGTRIAVNIFLD